MSSKFTVRILANQYPVCIHKTFIWMNRVRVKMQDANVQCGEVGGTDTTE